MRRPSPPFTGTHIANIALNKQIGLIFLLAEHQETCGLTSLSHESLTNDQLQTARSMILNFLEPEEDEKTQEPWISIPEWRVKFMEFPEPEETKCFEAVLTLIHTEAEHLGDKLWDPKNQEARAFLLRATNQINECVHYINRRLAAIKVSLNLFDLGEDADLAECEEILSGAGLKLADELKDAFFSKSYMDLGAFGYGMKNFHSATSIFAKNLLEFARGILTEEAIRRDYTAPTCDN